VRGAVVGALVVTALAVPAGTSSASASVTRLAPITYTADDGHTETLTPWQGTHVTVLVEATPRRSASVMAALVGKLDSAWSYYQTTTGFTPTPYYSLHGRTEIAEVTSTSCGGAACSWLGFTGVEILRSYFEVLYSGVQSSNQYDQVAFYEFGRNFWHYTAQLAFPNVDPQVGEPVTTGFAVWMRFRSMTAAHVSGAPFNGIPFTTFRAQVAQLAQQYEADPALTFAATLGANRSPGLYGGTDFWASLMMQLATRHGGQKFVSAFFHYASSLPAALTTGDAVTNWVRAASVAACVNLSTVFYDRWGFPRPDGTVTPRPPASTVPEPIGNC